MQHVAHRASDEIHTLRAEIERLTEALVTQTRAMQDRIELLKLHRRTLCRELEGFAIRPLGPHSPYFTCTYCKAMHQSPLAFQHTDSCIMHPPG